MHFEKSIFSIAFPLFVFVCTAQNIKVISKTKIYRQQVSADSNYKMVELRMLIPTIMYDLRYATENNFTRQRLYKKDHVTFLRLSVARALMNVQTELAKQNTGLKVYDAYRPYSVTKKMWDLVKDERYVANPAKGSGHNRGLSIDLTLINLTTGNELDMGTGFDNFSDTAHHDYKNLPAEVLSNRLLLKTIMERHGFNTLATEWWHYSWTNDRNYDVLDIGFERLKLNK